MVCNESVKVRHRERGDMEGHMQGCERVKGYNEIMGGTGGAAERR